MARQRAAEPKVKYRTFSGEELRRRRKQAGLARIELAYLVGRSIDTIGMWETGRLGEPRASDLSAFATVLDCSIDDLLTEVES